MPVERFVSEFIGPNMMWQRDWATSLQEQDSLPSGSRLPAQVEDASLGRPLQNLPISAAAGAISTPSARPHWHRDWTRYCVQPMRYCPSCAGELWYPSCGPDDPVVQWLWGFVWSYCVSAVRSAHPELMTYALDGNIFAFTHTPGRREWVPSMGDRTPTRCSCRWGRSAGLTIFNCKSANLFSDLADCNVGGKWTAAQ